MHRRGWGLSIGVALVLAVAWLAWAQTINRRTDIYNFVNGMEISGKRVTQWQQDTVTTGSCAAAGCDVTLTWTTAMSDATYVAVCTVLDATAGNETGLYVERIRTMAAASLTVAVANLGAGAITGTLHCAGWNG